MARKNRMKKLVHYMCSLCEDPSKFGATKLNKALWYADTIAYQMYGESISGEKSYVKRQFGPVPKKILATLDRLESDGSLLVKRTRHMGFEKKDLISLTDPDVSVFSDQEKEIIEEVVQVISNHHTAASISNLSHDIIWEAAEIGEEIPIYAVLASQAAPITDEDKAWADKIIAKRQ